MNNQATLDRLRELKLTGMFQAFEALLQLPVHQQPPADELLAQLTDAEHEYRQQRKTQMAIRAARFRYTASLEELHYGDGRNLDKTAILRLADCRFIDRSENIFLTGATGCGKSGRSI
jgi:DNA replication protein DnaC